MRKISIMLLAVFFMLSLTTMVLAVEKKASDIKLERGTKNVLLGWTEIPKQIVQTTKNSNLLVGVTVGTVKGILQAFSRTVSGAVDATTFTVAPAGPQPVKPSMLNSEPVAGAQAPAKAAAANK